MFAVKQIIRIVLMCVCFAICMARPDSGERIPLPGPGLSYGGIPYGSMSGNVADYFHRQGLARGNLRAPTSDIEYAPIEQYL